MAILDEFEKQPGETKYYDIHCEAFLAALGTTATAVPVVVWDSPITQLHPASWVQPGVLRVWASGGVSLQKYKATMPIVCDNEWREEAEITLKVRET